MAKGQPVILDTRSFPNKKEATAFFREMLYRYKPKERVSTSDSADLTALLKRHSDYTEKVGAGICHFEVMSADYGTQCFRVVRTDGTGADFSFIHCITGQTKT